MLTGTNFCKGDTREDGYKFWQYVKNIKRQDGTFKEVWIDPEIFKELQNRNRNSLKKKYHIMKSGNQ